MTGKADAVRAVSEQFKDRTNTVIEGIMAHLRDDNAKEILGPALSPLIGRGSLKAIVTFALYADVLRMVRDMVMADGEISDEEVQESLGLLSVLAAGFARVRKEYAPFASLTTLNARYFLAKYSSDSGLFGHANEQTKWAGVVACRKIEALCGDSEPLTTFGGSLVSWSEMVASSIGVSSSNQQPLDAIRSLCRSARPVNTCVLTREIVERYLINSDSVDLSEYTEIETDAAEKLCARQWPANGNDTGPDLNGILTLTTSAANHLSRLEGDLFLGQCSAVSDEAIKILCQHARPLYLGVTSVSSRAAEWLGSKRGHLCLEDLADLSPDAARSLARHPDIFVDTSLWPDDAAAAWSEAATDNPTSSAVNQEESSEAMLANQLASGIALNPEEADLPTPKPLDVEAATSGSRGDSRGKEPEDRVNADTSEQDWIQADYQTCEDLLCSGESRGDFIKDNVDRLSLWKNSAEAKDPRGQLLYGLCFFYGHGESENEPKAVEWFKRSAEQGDANAQYSLGMCYGNGWGVHRDEKTATQWYRKAAAQGYRAAVKVLTKAIAKQFVADDSCVNLNEFTQIEDAAAEVLSNYEGALYLSELYSISDAAAESLSKHSGDLDLRSVGTLSAKAAKALAQHRGVLDLSLLESLGGVEVKLFRDLNALAPLSLFESFTPEMEDLYRAAKQASQDDLANAWLYCHNPEFGRSAHEAFFDFWDTLSKCRRIPLWMMYDEEEESWNFFQGAQEEVVSRLKSICGDAGDRVVGS